MVSLASSQNSEQNEEQHGLNYSYKSSGTLHGNQSYKEKDKMNLSVIDEVFESREGRLIAEIENYEVLK